MQSHINILFSLRVQHNYFTNGICDCLEYMPDDGTAAIIKRFGCIIKNQPGGFALYASTASDIINWLAYIQQVTGQGGFTFKITATQPVFMLFTGMPVNNSCCILYNSSNPNNAITGGVVQLADTPVAPVCNMQVGIITICFADIAKAITAKTALQFKISYQATSTQWQYYVINRSGARAGSFIITGKNTVSFTGPEKVMIDNGEQAMLFSTGEVLLPLSQAPKYVFSLACALVITNGAGVAKTGKPQVVYKSLPTPNPLNAGTTVINGKSAASSPMYVYI